MPSGEQTHHAAVLQGVEISHSAEIASVAGLQRYLELVGIVLNEFDSEISYLPLAHIFDRQAQFCLKHTCSLCMYQAAFLLGAPSCDCLTASDFPSPFSLFVIGPYL